MVTLQPAVLGPRSEDSLGKGTMCDTEPIAALEAAVHARRSAACKPLGAAHLPAAPDPSPDSDPAHHRLLPNRRMSGDPRPVTLNSTPAAMAIDLSGTMTSCAAWCIIPATGVGTPIRRSNHDIGSVTYMAPVEVPSSCQIRLVVLCSE